MHRMNAVYMRVDDDTTGEVTAERKLHARAIRVSSFDNFQRLERWALCYQHIHNFSCAGRQFTAAHDIKGERSAEQCRILAYNLFYGVTNAQIGSFLPFVLDGTWFCALQSRAMFPSSLGFSHAHMPARTLLPQRGYPIATWGCCCPR